MKKIKILYAAGNTLNSKIQLYRFYQAAKNKYDLKIAAYIKSSPSINIDWTLDCLLNVYNPTHQYLDNDNLRLYMDQISMYNPDLIISDLEYFTSYVGKILNIPVWQCSSSIINFSIDHKEKYNLGLFKKYSYLTNKNPALTQRIVNMIDNSDKKFVYSHFGDLKNTIELKAGYEWIRPYHQVGHNSPTCQHNIVASFIYPNKKIISKIKDNSDIVMFSEITNEKYNNFILKNFSNEIEYYCNVKNSLYFICEGQISFLSDAFYNGKKAIIDHNFEDIESVTNSLISEKLKLSSFLNEDSFKDNNNIEVSNNADVQFLHEKIDYFIWQKENQLIYVN